MNLGKIAVGSVILLIMSTLGCINISENGSFVDKSGHTLKSSSEEVDLAQRVLLEFEEKGLPESAEGGVLFDGVLMSSREGHSGKLTLVFKVEKILYGEFSENNTGQGTIKIESPPWKEGGIQIQTGKSYRVFTVYLQGAYRTWAGAGTAIVKE